MPDQTQLYQTRLDLRLEAKPVQHSRSTQKPDQPKARPDETQKPDETISLPRAQSLALMANDFSLASTPDNPNPTRTQIRPEAYPAQNPPQSRSQTNPEKPDQSRCQPSQEKKPDKICQPSPTQNPDHNPIKLTRTHTRPEANPAQKPDQPREARADSSPAQ